MEVAARSLLLSCEEPVVLGPRNATLLGVIVGNTSYYSSFRLFVLYKVEVWGEVATYYR